MAEWVGFQSAWPQRSSWAQPPGTGTAIRPSCCFLDHFRKTVIQLANTKHIGTSAVFFDQFVHGHAIFFALSSQGHFSYCLCVISADRYFAKTMFKCYVSFERNFQKKIQNFVDYRVTLHHSPGFWLVVPGKHCRTSSRNRVPPMLWIRLETRTNSCQTDVVGIAPSGILSNTTSKLRIFTNKS